MTSLASSSDRNTLGEIGPRVFKVAGIVGIAGLAVGVILAAVQGEWAHFLRAYLTAFVIVVTISLGALFFVLVHHITRAGWSTVLRRIAEGIASNFIWLWILFIPVAISVFLAHPIYHWVHPGNDEILQHKEGFLNVPFWLIRAGVYFAIWGFLGTFYFRNSVAQDTSGDLSLTTRMQRLAPPAVIAFALTLTFSSIDWIKSLEPHWFSTMFGVYIFAASCCGFFSLLILIVYYLQRRGKLENEVTLEHYQDMGKLLFAFGVAFWAYITFSQFMLIWYANLPEETTWFLARAVGGWLPMTWLLIIGHFAIPFLLLVTKHTKRVPVVLAAIAGGMLVMHCVDMYWAVMPEVPIEILERAATKAELEAAVAAGEASIGWAPNLMDPALIVGLLGLLVAGTARRLSACSLVAVRDPRLQESLQFENV